MLSQTFSGTHQFVPPEVLTDESNEGFDGTKGIICLMSRYLGGRSGFIQYDLRKIAI